ncbi:MAG: hypothetical protein VR73_00090 [Gammaproteobacteria bacterium BRH_c0]|nr:MAG: hypothetical protein VR73_00090 [Gammaproteobacteria bacterium BRH_c0]
MLMAIKSKKSQLGINLIELMIGVAISLVILTGVLSVMLRVNVSGGEIVQSTRLNQQMRSALDLMSKELQRAGYVDWLAAWDQDGEDGPLSMDDDVNGDGKLNILDYYEAVTPVLNEMGLVQVNGNCILYSYDLDGDGGKSTGQFESFGFRLNNGAVQMRTSGNGHACDTGTWQSITDSSISITSLTFTLDYVADVDDGDSTFYSYTVAPATEWSDTPLTACTPDVAGEVPEDGDVLCLARRNIEIALEGQLASDAAVTMGLSTKVKIKNDHFNIATPAP